MISKGKMVAGLQGPYVGISYSKWLYDNRFYSNKLFNYVGDFLNSGRFSPVIGYQRKISKRYFIDVGLRFQDLSSYNIGIGNLAINPQFKFGYAF